MKQIMIYVAVMLATMVNAQAQVLQVKGMQRLDVPVQNDAVLQAVAISPQGDYLLLSTHSKQGLVKWDIASRTATTLTNDEGAGSDVHISADGKQIVYNEATYKNKRRHNAVKAVDASGSKRQTLVKATRHLQGFSLEGSTAAVMRDGKLSLHVLQGKKTSPTPPVLTHHHLKLYVTMPDGKTTMLAPNGADERYIWASLSPDGDKVLYHVSGRGTFVCSINGTNVIAMGNLLAPKWWDDNTVVGMHEVDNGMTIVASSVAARTLQGIEQTLTGDDVIATYPLPSHESGTIAFSTPDGSIYMLTVE